MEEERVHHAALSKPGKDPDSESIDIVWPMSHIFIEISDHMERKMSNIEQVEKAEPNSPIYKFIMLKRNMKSLHSKTQSSKIRHKDFRPSDSSVTLRGPPLDSETGWTGELWSKTNLLNWQN